MGNHKLLHMFIDANDTVGLTEEQKDEIEEALEECFIKELIKRINK